MVYSSALNTLIPIRHLVPNVSPPLILYRVKLIDDLLVFSDIELIGQDKCSPDIIAIPCCELITLESKKPRTLVSSASKALPFQLS